MRKPLTLEERVRRLEDRAAIDELIARYGLVMDNRDLAALPALFTDDVVVRSAGRGMQALGRDAAVQLFTDRFRLLGPSNHVTHDRILRFDPEDPDRARGMVLSHAEMEVEGRAMVAALRYVDEYRRQHGCWRFSRRNLHFMYYVPAESYAAAFSNASQAQSSADRIPVAIDWSEQLSAWRSEYGDWPA